MRNASGGGELPRFTLVFAEEASERGILRAILEKKCAAVQLADAQNAICYAAPEYVRYALFLLKAKYHLIK